MSTTVEHCYNDYDLGYNVSAVITYTAMYDPAWSTTVIIDGTGYKLYNIPRI